jgi:beta-glucanase (GH16 family)
MRRGCAVAIAVAGALLALPIPATASATVDVHNTTSAPRCGGEVPAPPPTGGQWTCTFDDEFNDSTGDPDSLNRSWWTPQVSATSDFTTGSSGNQVCYEDSPNNVSVSGGALHLTVEKESAPFSCGGLFTTQFTGGMVSTGGKFDQTYGRFEVRALLPQSVLPGLQETLWLYPQNPTYGAWPASGEIDFAEFYSLYSVFDVPFVHYNYDSSDPVTDTNHDTTDCTINPAQYNDYAVVWQPGRLTMSLNGTTCLIDNYVPDGGLSATAPFDQPFFIVLSQALGINANAYDSLLTQLPATLSIEYVRSWMASGATGAQPSTSTPDPTSGTGSKKPAKAVAIAITDIKQRASRWSLSRGTTFAFTLSRAATVTVVFKHLVRGYRVGKSCVEPSRQHHSGSRCELSAGAGKLTGIKGRAGRNTIAFHGRLSNGRRLSPGTYSVTISAGGRSSRSISFTIIGR